MVPPKEDLVSVADCALTREECAKSRKGVVISLLAITVTVLLSAVVYAWTTGADVKINTQAINRNTRDIAEMRSDLKRLPADIATEVRAVVREEMSRK